MKWETLGLLLGGLLLFSAGALAETHIPGGFVSGTWTLVGSPYILDGNAVVHQDSTLTIQPGVGVLMSPGRRFRCEGQLLAVGTQQDSIRFIATDTTQGSEGLDFLNTNLSPRDSSKLVYCDILYGVGSPAPDPYMHGGGIYIKNSSRLLVGHCHISHCRTRNVIGANGGNGAPGTPAGQDGQPGQDAATGGGGAIYCANSSPILCLNTITLNRTGSATGGNGGNGGNGGSYFGDAYGGDGGQGGAATSGRGAGICLSNSNALIQANLIAMNYTGDAQGGAGGRGGYAFAATYGDWSYGGHGGAGGIAHAGSGGAANCEQSHSLFVNNLFYQNVLGDGSGGAGGDGGDVPQFGGGTAGYGGIGGNGFGGNGYAYFDSLSFDTLRAGTIVDHVVINLGHGGNGGQAGNGGPFAPSGQGYNGNRIIYAVGLIISNSIIWNNADPTISSTASVSYSDIQNGFPGIGNIAVDPLFVSTPQGSYFLSQIAAGQAQQSPCVNAGNPMSPMIIGTTRTDGIQDAGIIDMGYHYPLFTTAPAVSVTLTPYGIPIEIPATGGSFNYDISVANTGSTTVSADVWCMVTLPNGSPYGPTLGPFSFIFPAGFNNGRNRTQSVPGVAPPGNYTYHAYIGDYPGTIWDQDSFPFTKLSTGNGKWVVQWENTGDPFEAWRQPFNEVLPEIYSLEQNYPNPFNAQTTIRYDLPQTSFVKLAIYDARGRQVADLVNGVRAAGVQELTFDASGLTSGIYFYRLQAGTFSEVKKLILVK